MSLAESLIADSEQEITTSDGLRWRIRRVDSRLIAEQGIGLLTILPRPEGAVEAVMEAQQLGEGSQEIRNRLTKFLTSHLQQRLTPGQAAEMAMRQNAIVCAGVQAGAKPGEEIAPITLCPTQSNESRDQSRIWVGRLPTSTQKELHAAIMHLTAGGAGSHLQTFRGDP